MGKSFWKDCKKEKCDRESFLEISQEGKSVGARVWEWNHERERNEEKGGMEMEVEP